MMQLISKIMIGILTLFFILILTGVIGVFMIIKINDSYKGSFRKELKAQDKSSPKALVIYQPSKSKVSAEVAEKFAEGLYSSGYDVTITYPGKKMEAEMSEYSLISFGSPVFFGRTSAAVTEAMKQLKNASGKTVIIYSVGGSAEEPELDTMKQQFTDVTPKVATKFLVSDTDVEKNAFELGIRVGRESKGKQ